MKWFWQKRSTEECEKPKGKEFKYSLSYETKEFDVGCTTALIVFKDGREVHTKFYGEVDQYIDTGSIFNRKQEPWKTYPPNVWNSVDKYKGFLQSIEAGKEVKVVDDWNSPMYSWVGVIYHLEIVETIPHVVNYNVASVVTEEVK